MVRPFCGQGEPGNKRIWRGTWNGSGQQTVDEITYYSVNGQKLATYGLATQVGCSFSCSPTPPLYTGLSAKFYATQSATFLYFGGKLVKNAAGNVHSDIRGSIGKYFPYGQERPSATADGKEKFATYFRDSETGLDYAQNRYHSPGQGRFLTPDPYMASGGPASPGSWNRYVYVGGDPINRTDRAGLEWTNNYDFQAWISSYYTGGAINSREAEGEAQYCANIGVSCPPSNGAGCFGNAFLASSSCAPDPGPDPTPPPPPEPPVDNCPPRFRNWINAHGADAAATGFDEANVLALSAIESGWGTSRFAQDNSFFNLETQGLDGSQPALKFAYQLGWDQAREPNGRDRRGRAVYAFVATYRTASDAFKSFAVHMGSSVTGVTDPATFGRIAVGKGINAGRSADFVGMANTFKDCLK